jgi:hypothetical protein
MNLAALVSELEVPAFHHKRSTSEVHTVALLHNQPLGLRLPLERILEGKSTQEIDDR